jgi:hypothetical protein
MDLSGESLDIVAEGITLNGSPVEFFPISGWVAAGETWTYASSTTFTISGDKTGKYSPGMRVKLTQTTVKYFIITGVSYGSPNTTVTVFGGSSYSLANAAITDPYYSMLLAPQGFPGDTEISKLDLSTYSLTLNDQTVTFYPIDGWLAAGETWTYASADDPTFTLTISGDKTGKYSPGMRIKLTQTTVKYFIITGVSYGSPNTTITIYGGTDYDLANATITSPFFSVQKAPLGFPLNPAKWAVVVTDNQTRSQSSPVEGTWYNIGSTSITVPIGSWYVEYTLIPLINCSGTNSSLYLTLSTANNSETNTDFTRIQYAGAANAIGVSITAREMLTLAAKTAYYLNAKAGTASTSIYFYGALAPTNLRAISAYL